MGELNPCKQCGAEAVEQVRGLLRKGDPGWVEPSGPGAETSNALLNAEDFRVACSKCENATGWNKSNYTDYMKFVWNRENPPRRSEEDESGEEELSDRWQSAK